MVQDSLALRQAGPRTRVAAEARHRRAGDYPVAELLPTCKKLAGVFQLSRPGLQVTVRLGAETPFNR
jgi:hypothetical protein